MRAAARTSLPSNGFEEIVNWRGDLPVTEIVIALFDKASAADAAVRDLEAARIPSAMVEREARGSRGRGGSASGWHRRTSAWLRPLVTVAVDEMHAPAVTGILKLYGAVNIEERSRRST
jgi:hypothetical protein